MSEQSNGPANVVTQIINSAAPAEKPSAPVVPAAETPAVIQEQQSVPESNKGVDEFASRFAALTKRERQVQEEKARAKAEVERLAKYAELEQKAKQDPLAVLSTYGIDLDTLLMAAAGQQKTPPTVEEQLAELKAQLQKEKDDVRQAEENKRLEAEKAYQASIDEAILSHQNAITDHLSKNKDKYELISLHGTEDLVWDTVEAYFENHGKVLSPEEASDMVENYLYEQTQKALKLSKFQGKAPAEPTVETPKPGLKETYINPSVQAKPVVSTLTAALTSSAPDKTSTERLSADESKRRAAEFLANAWKQHTK